MTENTITKYGRIIGNYAGIKKHSGRINHAIINIKTNDNLTYEADVNIGSSRNYKNGVFARRDSEDKFFILKQNIDQNSINQTYPLGLNYDVKQNYVKNFNLTESDFKFYNSFQIYEIILKLVQNTDLIIVYGQIWIDYINDQVRGQGIHDIHANSINDSSDNDGLIGFYNSFDGTITWVFSIFSDKYL